MFALFLALWLLVFGVALAVYVGTVRGAPSTIPV